MCGVAALFATLAISAPVAMSQGNSVIVESKTVFMGQADVQVGVYVSNTTDILGIVLPLEFRTISGSAFYALPMSRQINAAGRVYTSPLGPQPPLGAPGISINNQYPAVGAQECSGPVSHTFASVSQQLDPVSPDGFLMACVSQDGAVDDPDGIVLPPGSETPGVDEPSFYFRFKVPNMRAASGQFEIDTCCVKPANHLSFVDRNTEIIVPEFTKGIITVKSPLENSVIVESKEVAQGAEGVFIGVWISNISDDYYGNSIYKIVLPFEFRSLDAGAFVSGPVIRGFNPDGRLIRTAIGPWAQTTSTPPKVTERDYPHASENSCSGPVSQSYTDSSSQFDDNSPNGHLFMSEVQEGAHFDPISIPRGGETPGVDPPSYYFLFKVTAVSGRFEIDTCCVGPGLHLAFYDIDNQEYIPSFTKGTISIGCFCRCHGDPDCNGYLDIVDVVRTVNTAFRGLASITDQDCTHARTDVDANAMTNVLDVARMIDVVFGGESRDDVFVDPCAE